MFQNQDSFSEKKSVTPIFFSSSISDTSNSLSADTVKIYRMEHFLADVLYILFFQSQ